ncbi:MAG: cobalamin-dependent protein [Eggerthellaceae bacterium]|nr:cobalamin-dependent protein [Eggerthellaceae bacterium]
MGKIKELLEQLDDEGALAEAKAQLAAGTAPEEVLDECKEAMVTIGDEFSEGRMFVSDLMMAADIFESISAEVLPLIKGTDAGPGKGTVILGTVEGDIHNIGKDIVSNMLLVSGFNVVDLGVNVAPDAFVAALKENDAKVLALSCLLVSCYGSIKNTVDALQAAGLRDGVTVIIGGGPIDDHVVEYSGADAFGHDPQDAVRLCEEALA